MAALTEPVDLLLWAALPIDKKLAFTTANAVGVVVGLRAAQALVVVGTVGAALSSGVVLVPPAADSVAVVHATRTADPS